MVEVEDKSVLCIFLANLGQLSTWGPPRLWNVTHVCALPEWEVLLPKLCFSILIPVQAPLLIVHPQPYHLLSVLS
jgi:hypothetical protein